MTNYAKLGEFTACKTQAIAAAKRRRSYLHVLQDKADTLKGWAGHSIEAEGLTSLLQEAIRAEAEMLAAMETANQDAALCGEQLIDFRLINKLLVTAH